MKIVDIFDNRLFSFQYEGSGSGVNEYGRLMDLWNDVSYLRDFAKNNNVSNVNGFVNDRLKDAENIEDLLYEIVNTEKKLEEYFRPLRDSETELRILSLQKGKVSNRDGLRIYAIKIDEDCFVITGGAIKMSQTMQEHPETNTELSKLKKAQGYLRGNGVFDEDSFFEFKNEWE